VEPLALKVGYSQYYFITVLNSGETVHRDLRLSVVEEGDVDLEVIPVKYTELLINDSRKFILKFYPLYEIEQGSLSLKITSQNYQTMRTLPFNVVNETVTPEELSAEISNYHSTIQNFEEQIQDLKSRGLETSYAENYLESMGEKLVAAEAALDAGDLELTRAWLNEVLNDFDSFVDVINEFTLTEPSILPLVLISFLFAVAGIILLVSFKKKVLLQKYYVILKRRFLTWWMLKRLKK
jgi:hypothetical protein